MTSAQDSDLMRIRPLRLARQWKQPERHVIECCLQSVRAGLLSLRWDLLCPRCQGAKVSADRLDELPRDGHCPSCNISYERDFAANVELTFRPSGNVRDVADGEFCLFGPMSTPHAKLQQTVPPGETVEIAHRFKPAPYRVRTLRPGGEAHVDWEDGPFPEIVATLAEVTAGNPAPDGVLRLINRAEKPVTIVVESREWAADALTAHRVVTYQTFRDLFSGEVLKPGDEVEIETVTLMFTDLKGSTAMYGRIGDVKAYKYVQEHFAFLSMAVRAHNGSIVKTIGDAVMAAFVDPRDAMRAAIDIQEHTVELREKTGEDGLVIKLGFHTGPCIAVTLNDRLDYFGTTVKLASRFQEESGGDDIVFSTSVADDPAIAPLLGRFDYTTERADVKGFDVPISFHRIASYGLSAAAAAAAE
jgi:class 3 adenylate cyclase